MTRYLEPRFSVGGGGAAYEAGWARTFSPEPRCTCGDPAALHHETTEDPFSSACQVEGCKCIRYSEVPS